MSGRQRLTSLGLQSTAPAAGGARWKLSPAGITGADFTTHRWATIETSKEARMLNG